MGSTSGEIPLDMCFKEFIEKVRGIRFRDVARGTMLYRSLLEEFNWKKRLSLDAEDREMRRAARALAVED